MQKLREQTGWLQPTGWTSLHPDHGIDGDHPAAALVATWLLIAHRLTETVPATIDPAIRKAYARAGRAAPDVRIVQLRPTNPRTTPTNPTTAPGRATRRESDHRWWVSPFIRNQPHGPAGTLRKPILIFPFINGPRGKSVRASTTVRLLGHPKPRTPHPHRRPAADTSTTT